MSLQTSRTYINFQLDVHITLTLKRCTYEKAPIPKGFISIRLLIKSNIPFGTYKKALLYNKALF